MATVYLEQEQEQLKIAEEYNNNAMFNNVNMSAMTKEKYIDLKIEEDDNLKQFCSYTYQLTQEEYALDPEEINAIFDRRLLYFMQNGSYIVFNIFVILFNIYFDIEDANIFSQIIATEKQMQSLTSILSCLSNTAFLKGRLRQYLVEEFTYEQIICIFSVLSTFNINEEIQNVNNTYFDSLNVELKFTNKYLVVNDEEETNQFNKIWYDLSNEEVKTQEPFKTNIDCINKYVDSITDVETDYDYNKYISKVLIVLRNYCNISSIKLKTEQYESLFYIMSNENTSRKIKFKIILALLSSKTISPHLLNLGLYFGLK